MYWEEHDNIEPEVLVVGDYGIFHLIHTQKDLPPPNSSEICGGSRRKHYSTGTQRYPIEEAIDQGKRLCKDCKKWMGKLYGVDVYNCSVCSRLSLIADKEYYELNLNNAFEPDTVVLCADCIERISDMSLDM